MREIINCCAASLLSPSPPPPPPAFHLLPTSLKYSGQGHFPLRNADSQIDTAHREIDTADSDLWIATANSKCW